MEEKTWNQVSGPSASQIIAVLLDRLGGGPQTMTATEIDKYSPLAVLMSRQATSLTVQVGDAENPANNEER